MTSLAAIHRAKSHNWVEVSPSHEMCSICLVSLPKTTDLEAVPGCPGRIEVRR